MVKVINVKENNNSPEYAVFLLDSEINDSKSLGTNVIIVIHGYGSSGYGGVMKQEIFEFLQKAKKQKRIIDFVKGEEWGHLSEKVALICKHNPELILHSQIQNLNSGVTVVWVQ